MCIFSAVPPVGGDEPLAGQQPGAPGPQARQHHEVHQGNKSVSQSVSQSVSSCQYRFAQKMIILYKMSHFSANLVLTITFLL